MGKEIWRRKNLVLKKYGYSSVAYSIKEKPKDKDLEEQKVGKRKQKADIFVPAQIVTKGEKVGKKAGRKI